MSKLKFGITLFSSCLALIISGCHSYDNFTTYYNTYYNSNRLLKESEDEFEFQDEKKRVTPRVIVPEPQFKVPQTSKTGAPAFMDEFVISQQKLQPVKIKLDSIIIKGSKILAKHSKSDYVESTLLLMAKSYFYQGLWLPCQIKCSELVDRFKDGDLVPDAMLLQSKSVIMQQNYPAGKTMLSRTVDVAWQKSRWDILSEAFRLQAELSLLDNDVDGALRPYKQAIAQSENEELRAKWQIDLASIYFKLGRFKDAEKSFRKVHQYSPDYMGDFEAYVYEAQCKIRLGDTLQGEKILKKLENDGKYDEWHAYIAAARMTAIRLKGDSLGMKISEKSADSAYMNNPSINAVYFEKAAELFNKKEYTESRKYFARSRNQRSSFSKTSDKMFFLLNSWDGKRNTIAPLQTKLDSNQTLNDTSRIIYAQMAFELGRVHEEMGNPDSTLHYFKLSSQHSVLSDTTSARYLFAYSRVVRDSNAWQSDSLLELIVDRYPRTVYGKEAGRMLGYTDKYLIDSVADIYQSGLSLRRNREFPIAIKQFLTVYNNYPLSNYSPKSLYATGWIFEKELKQLDSALYYYKIILEKYPASEYAKDVKPSVDYLLAVKSGISKPGTPQVVDPPAIRLDPIPDKPAETPKKDAKTKPNEGLNPMDFFKDPGKAINKTLDDINPQKLIKGTMDQISDPNNLIPKITVPTNGTPPKTEMPPDTSGVRSFTPKKSN